MLTINHPSITLIWYKCKGEKQMKQRNLRAGDMALIGMFAALMAVGANITSMAPFLQVAGIPLSLQPFFCLLAAMLLGARRAAIAMTVYALAGLAGAPVFAQFSAGFAPFIGKSGGFILAYIPAAFAAGWLLEKTKTRPPALCMGLFDRYRRHLYHWHDLYVYCAEIMASCSDQLRNGLVLHDMVFHKRYRFSTVIGINRACRLQVYS